jgi:hypothetical protein
MKPTARSVDAVGKDVPESAVVPEFEAPADTSRGLLVARPENSWTSMAITVEEAIVAVTLVSGWAFAAYHSSPSESLFPAWKAPTFVQELPPESVTFVMWLLPPALALTESTTRSPATVGAGNVAVSVAEAELSLALAAWASCGGEDGAAGLTVRVTDVLWVADVPVPVTVTA